MSNIYGTLLADAAVPLGSNATHYDTFGQGGFRSVETLAERDAIYVGTDLDSDGLSSGLRKADMLVAVVETGKLYQLHTDDFLTLSDGDKLVALGDNTNWIEFASSDVDKAYVDAQDAALQTQITTVSNYREFRQVYNFGSLPVPGTQGVLYMPQNGDEANKLYIWNGATYVTLSTDEANLVHKSGVETLNGVKTFADATIFRNDIYAPSGVLYGSKGNFSDVFDAAKYKLKTFDLALYNPAQSGGAPNGTIELGNPAQSTKITGHNIIFGATETSYFNGAGTNLSVGQGVYSGTLNATIGVVIGNTYVNGYYYAPPQNGLIVEGNIGVGLSDPTEKVHVVGNVKANSFMGDGSQLTGVAKPQDVTNEANNRANADNNLQYQITQNLASAVYQLGAASGTLLKKGWSNQATAYQSAVLAGESSTASGAYSTVVSGYINKTLGHWGTIIGGDNNTIGPANAQAVGAIIGSTSCTVNSRLCFVSNSTSCTINAGCDNTTLIGCTNLTITSGTNQTYINNVLYVAGGGGGGAPADVTKAYVDSADANLQGQVNTQASRVTANETNIGTLGNLTTTAKDNVVNAINEVKSGSVAKSYVDNADTALSNNITSNTDAIALRAPLASPALTGVPTAPTPGNLTANNQLATTLFVANNLALMQSLIIVERPDGTNRFLNSWPGLSDCPNGSTIRICGNFGSASALYLTPSFCNIVVEANAVFTFQRLCPQTTQPQSGNVGRMIISGPGTLKGNIIFYDTYPAKLTIQNLRLEGEVQSGGDTVTRLIPDVTLHNVTIVSAPGRPVLNTGARTANGTTMYFRFRFFQCRFHVSGNTTAGTPAAALLLTTNNYAPGPQDAVDKANCLLSVINCHFIGDGTNTILDTTTGFATTYFANCTAEGMAGPYPTSDTGLVRFG